MSETHRSRARRGPRWLTLGATVLLLAACGSSTGSSAGAPSAASATPAASVAEAVKPGFGFTISDGRWENIAMTPGDVPLESIDVRGDGIFFFAHPRVVKPDGSLDLSVKMTAAGISDWMANDQNLTVGPVTDVTIGGLKGKRFDIALPPGAVVPTGDCPVPRCLRLLSAQGSTWQ